MKNTASKLTLIASLLALAFAFAAPVARAADDDAAKAEKKKKKMEADLKKYDKNANGKIDADEDAVRKSDMAKAKAAKDAKKNK